MSQANKYSVKSVFANDVRRFNLTTPTFTTLRKALADVYQKPAERLSVQYRDDENELITLEQDNELLEAFKVAGGLALKLVVNLKDAEAEPVQPQPEPVVSAAEPVVVPSPKAVVRSPSPARTPRAPSVVVPSPKAVVRSPSPSPTPSPSTPPPRTQSSDSKEEPQSERPSCEELWVLVSSLLETVNVQDLVTRVVPVLSADKTWENPSAKSLATAVLSVLPELATHPSIVVLLSFLDDPEVAAIAEQVIQQIAAQRPFWLPLLSMLPAFAAQLPQLHAQLPTLLPLFASSCPLFGENSDFFSSLFNQFPTEATTEAPREEAQQQQQASARAGTHPNVSCDGCGQHPLVGDRFNCTVCPNFDLCGPCEKKDLHPAEHTLLKIRPAPAVPEKVIHRGITCDGCGKSPIEGVRFKCSVCRDFDLCTACEAKGEHPNDHGLLKIKLPVPPRAGPRARHHGPHRHPHHGFPHHGPHHGFPHGPHGLPHGPFARGPHGFPHGPHGFPYGPHHFHPFAGGAERRGAPFGRFGGPFGRPGCGPRPFGPFGAFGPFGLFAQQAQAFAEQAANATTTQESKEPQAPASQPAAKPSSVFVSDVTVADGSVHGPNLSLTKTWSVKNDGSIAWPAGTKLIFLRGDRDMSTAEEFPAPQAQPGQTVEVSVQLVTPAQPGKYSVYFSLADADRNVFGARLWAELAVAALSAPVSASTPSPSPTPSRTPSPSPRPDYVIVEDGRDTDDEEEEAALPEPTGPFAVQLKALESMGFGDRSRNEALLKQHRGNVQQVLNLLLAN